AARRVRATCSASRVLPTPPGPVSVTRRARVSNCFTSAVSALRPTRLVTSAGKRSLLPNPLRTIVSAPASASTTVRRPWTTARRHQDHWATPTVTPEDRTIGDRGHMRSRCRQFYACAVAPPLRTWTVTPTRRLGAADDLSHRTGHQARTP